MGLPVDEDYYLKFMRSIILSAERLKNAPIQVKISVFVLLRELLEEYFDIDNPPQKYRKLVEIMTKDDYGAFEWMGRWI